ncbi:MAG: S8 family serine peptidase [Candidatus Helarchaeota archaeon]
MRVRVIVQTRGPLTPTQSALLNKDYHSIKILSIFSLTNGFVAELPLGLILNLIKLPWVSFIWLDRMIKIPPFTATLQSTPSFTTSACSMVGNSSGFGGYNGTNVIIAILDTGIDLFHQDLGGVNLSTDYSSYLEDFNITELKIIGHVNFVEINPYPLDFHGHGTYVAGIVAGTNGTGIAPGAQLLNVKVLSDLGIGYWSWIISGIEWSATHGADIITMAFDTQAWGLPGLPSDPLNSAIDAVVDLGITVVTAAGDEGPAYFSIGSPGMSLKALTVGAYDGILEDIWEQSGRGPTLDFITKPDILAPGVNITSTCLTEYDLPFNVSGIISFSTYGTRIPNTNYSIANGTAAAAAYVAGVVALLLQQDQFLDPESVKMILQETASPLKMGSDHDAWGAGLINITRAQEYLTQNNLTSNLNTTRVFTPMLFYDGGLSNSNNASNITLLLSNYGSNVVLLNQSVLSTVTHLLMGFYGLEYNGTFSWLYEGTILREMHDAISFFNYSTIVSVLELGPFFIVIEVEGWNNSNGFRTNIHVINADPVGQYNVSLICSYTPDLFLNSLNDTLQYSSSLDSWFGNETWNGSTVYWGMNGSRVSLEHQSTTNGSIFGHTNLLATEMGNNTIGSKWSLTPTSLLGYKQNANLTSCIAFGDNYTDLLTNLNDTWDRLSLSTGNDLAILTVNDFSRMTRVGDVYSTQSLVMNIGRNTLSNINTAFMINRTEGDEGEVWLSYSQINSLDPFEFQWVNTSYSPTKPDIYAAFWIVGTEASIYEIIALLPYWNDFMNGSFVLSSEDYALDNIYAKNIFVQEESTPYLKKMATIFPNQGGIAPFELYFPNDFSVMNCTILSNYRLGSLSYQLSSPNLTLVEPMLTISINSSIPKYAILNVLVMIPMFPFEGNYTATLTISNDGQEICNFTLSFCIRYPLARALFYRPSPALSLEGFEDFESLDLFQLYEAFTKRLDTIYGNFYQFYNLIRNSGVDLDDFSLLSALDMSVELNSTVLSLLDAFIICDPLVNLTTSEINNLTQFVNDGKSLYIWLEPDSAGMASIRTLVENFGFNVSESISNDTSTFTDFYSHRLTYNLTQVQAESYIFFNITGSASSIINSSTNDVFSCFHETDPGNDTVGGDFTNGRVLAVGDSDLFKNFNISSEDNLIFANNTIQWLLTRKIITELNMQGEKYESTFRLNEFIYFSIHLETILGTNVLTNDTMVFVVFLFPDNTNLFWVALPTIDSWYNTLWLDNFTNTPGRYGIVFMINSSNALTTFHFQAFDILPAGEPDTSPSLPEVPDSNLIGAIFVLTIISLIVLTLILIFLMNRYELRRRMEAITTEKKKRDLGNVVSSIVALNTEMHHALSNPKISDEEKVLIFKSSMKKHKKLLKQSKKLDI